MLSSTYLLLDVKETNVFSKQRCRKGGWEFLSISPVYRHILFSVLIDITERNKTVTCINNPIKFVILFSVNPPHSNKIAIRIYHLRDLNLNMFYRLFQTHKVYAESQSLSTFNMIINIFMYLSSVKIWLHHSLSQLPLDFSLCLPNKLGFQF